MIVELTEKEVEVLKNVLSEARLVEDTDEYDDADLGVGVDPKKYRAQKAKQMSLAGKVDNVTPKRNPRELAVEEFKPKFEKIMEPLLDVGFRKDKYRYGCYSLGDTIVGYDYDKETESIKLFVNRLYIANEQFDVDDLDNFYTRAEKIATHVVR